MTTRWEQVRCSCEVVVVETWYWCGEDGHGLIRRGGEVETSCLRNDRRIL